MVLIAALLMVSFASCNKASETATPQEETAATEEGTALQAPVEEQAVPPAEVVQPQAAAPLQSPAAASQQRETTPRKQTARASSTASQAPALEQSSQARESESQPVVAPSPSRRVDAGDTGAAAGKSVQPTADAPATPAAPPKPTTAALPEGTVIDVRLSNALSSATNQVGDKFTAILERDLKVGDEVLAPKGSRVTGKVTDVAASGKVKGLARMAVTLTGIEVGEDRYTLDTNTVSAEAENTKSRDAKVIGGAAGVGAVIGAIAGGKKGAAIGAGVGGGAGTAGVLATKGKEVEFASEHKFSFRLQKDLEMKIR